MLKLAGECRATHNPHTTHTVAQIIAESDPSAQAFLFGSVPLKTYLPDGDIDVGARLIPNSSERVRDFFENLTNTLHRESRNPYAKHLVRYVNFVNAAEVKIVKCVVGNILVDISANTTGALAAVCFFEEVDREIGHQVGLVRVAGGLDSDFFAVGIRVCNTWWCDLERLE